MRQTLGKWYSFWKQKDDDKFIVNTNADDKSLAFNFANNFYVTFSLQLN